MQEEMKRAVLAMDPDNPTLRVEFEECLSVLGTLGSECCQTHAAKVRDECGSFADERGFAAFGAVWCRREIGGRWFRPLFVRSGLI